MNHRLKEARKALGLNQTEFGQRLGVTFSAISGIESGRRVFTEQMILAACREYGINETWLRTGEGDMFSVSRSDLLKQLVEHYELDDLDRKILELYLPLPDTQKRVIKSFALKLAEAADAQIVENREVIIDGLTKDEAHALVEQRYKDAKKGAV